MTRPAPVSGFPELLPAQRTAELAVIEQLARTFELHGFTNLETRMVEPLDRLLKGGEIDQEIYLLRRLHADDDTDSGLGLHYDLTVPFARYVVEHAGKLQFPFRRYQIQKAWRGERPQEGRFREFTQADIDVVGRESLPFHHDIEVARVMAAALRDLPLPPLSMQVNNRKLIEGFYRGLGAPTPAAVMRVIDKLDKVPAHDVRSMLIAQADLSSAQADKCLELAAIRTADASFVEQVRSLGVEHEQLDIGLGELAAVIEGCVESASAKFRVEANLRIARGLDYYTGTVFEIYMTGYEFLKSVGGGGRYDALAADAGTAYPGVGISFGISRTLIPLLSRGLLVASRSVPSVALVAVSAERCRADSDAIAAALRSRGIPTEVAATAAKYGRQIRYAERRGIPFVWFPGGEAEPDSVRDIRSGEQVPADRAVWTPPLEDVRPQVEYKEPSL
jgi:histidyl-tRNA synthetase